jgi:hypothetical protein
VPTSLVRCAFARVCDARCSQWLGLVAFCDIGALQFRPV